MIRYPAWNLELGVRQHEEQVGIVVYLLCGWKGEREMMNRGRGTVQLSTVQQPEWGVIVWVLILKITHSLNDYRSS
jgi:hypothetical protein